MKFALIGHPVAGSLSPVLFNAAYGSSHSYELFDSPFFAECWKYFLGNYYGINVTAPYKQDAFARCLELSPNAASTGAVNLVLRDGLRGYNTDVDGVMYALKGIVGESAQVVGTGGAARAAIAGALRLGFKVGLWGRSPEKVAELNDRFGLGEAPFHPDVVIYTLPGSAPVPSDLPLEHAVVLEANYRDPKLRDLPCMMYIPGVRWLLGQAIAGYRLFTGEEPSVAAMEAALEQILQ
ncbi:MAG: hypothetical protein IKR38_03345 [Bacteroidales bacterium]|nr:hypothetical protein [Bacteroidales bacterium]